MNKVNLIGRLTRDPELKYTKENTAYCKYGLAVERKYKKDGQPDCDFLNCISWGKGGEFVSKYFAKGVRIGIVGRIQTGSFEKDDGTKIYTTDIVVEEHFFADGKRDSQGDAHEPVQNNEGFQAVSDDDELPFN